MVLNAEIKILQSGSYTVMNNGSDITLQPGFYVVKNNIEVDDIILTGSGEHHFILCDGVQIEADILNVPSGQTAIIYGQVNNSGRLYIPFGADDTGETEACIGGRSGQSCGTVIIHGGDIDVVGRSEAAGIGGGKGGNGGTVTIYGGNINAKGGSGAGAGIGGGDDGSGGIVTIYGGHIEAKGGDFGAGIGGGDDGNGAIVTIHGGKVIARASELGAGIGTGRNNKDIINYTGQLTVTGGEVYAYGSTSEFEGGSAGIGGGRNANGSNVTISGGYVYAQGGENGAGIGSGCEPLFGGGIQGGSLTVTGGRVEAYGGVDAAGIGGGEDADGGTVNISGGYVYAKGSYGGAGIGGGEGGDGANVTITGGTVHASAGGGDTGNRAIGPGKGCDAYGQLTIGDLMMVRSERLATAGERKNMCWYRTDVHVEPCTHPNATYTVDGINADDHHTEHCLYCTTQFALELHHFENDTCTVCHVHGSMDTISIYLPEIGEGGSYVNGDYQDNPVVYRMVTNSTFYFPAAPQDPQGMDFAGWREGDTTGLHTFIAGDGEELYLVGSSFTVSENVSFTSRFHKINLFNTAGNWNDTSNWFWHEVPNGSDVVIGANATIPDNYIAIADSIAIDGGSITIADSGQLIHNNEGVIATVQKNIGKYTVPSGAGTTDGWYFIASPVCTEYTPKGTMLSNTYDLYRLNNTIWENWKQTGDHYHFDLENSHGYLYANSEDVTLEFTGVVLPSAASKNVDVNVGFNLIGNPFLHNVYANRTYYKMNSDRTGIVAVENYQSNPIAPCTGILVNADAAGTVTFTKEAPALSSNNGNLNIVLSQVPEPVEGPARNNGGVSTSSTTATLDNAIVTFNEGNKLQKFYFGNNAKIYIPQGGKDYAIASVSAGRDGVHTVSTTEVPVIFKANENGTYTITVNPEGVNLAYLHLIDNMTGADVDLLVPEPVEGPAWYGNGSKGGVSTSSTTAATYTFTAKTTDYESRFKLVFASVCEDADSDNEDFAFISNGNIIVNGTGTLQVIDMLGRTLLTREAIPHSAFLIPHSSFSPGVYVLRLIDGDNIRTQKIIIE